MATTLRVRVIGDASQLERTYKRAAASTSAFNKSVTKAGRGAAVGSGLFGRLGRSVAFASTSFLGGAGLAFAVSAAFKEMSQGAKVSAQTEAVLKSTGHGANVTAKQVDSLAKSLLAKSGVDDETIKAGENMILTFRNIRNEVGAGNDIFTQASKAVLDMDVHMSHGNVTQESLAKKAIIVGKALNDPVKGLTALRRVGVQFTDQQENQIKALVKSGDVMGAQKIILRELNKEFGGSAAALGGTLPGKINILRESLLNLSASLVVQLVPAITRVVDRLNRWLSNVQNQHRVQATFARILQFVGSALRTLRGIMQGLNGVTGSLTNSVKLLTAAFIAFKAVGIAASLSRTIQTMLGLRAATEAASGGVATVGAKTSAEAAKASVKARSFRLSAKNLRGSLTRLTSTPYIITFAMVAIGAELIAKKIASLQQMVLGAKDRKLAKGSKTEKSLVPSLVRQIGAQKAGGASTADVLASLREKLGGSQISEDLIGQALRQYGERNITKRGSPDDRAFAKGLSASAKKKAQKMAAAATDALKKNAPKLTAEQRNAIIERRNQFFDSLTDRRLNRIQDLDIGQQAGALDAIAGDIQARIGKTKDVTRKLNLEDKLLDVQRQSKDAREQVAQNFIDRLQFNVDKTAATKTFADDIATRQILRNHLIARISADKGNIDLQRQLLSVNQELADIQQQQKEEAQANLLDRLQFGIEKADATKTLKDDIAPRVALRKSLIAALKTDKNNLDLQRQLLQVNVDIRDKQQEQREAVRAAKAKQREAQRDAIRGRQFRTLGLTKEGDEIIPGIANLKKRAANLTKALKGVTGTFASKSKIRLKGIQKALVDAMLPGHNIPEVRAKIKELLDGISQELKDNKNSPTKGLRAVSTRALTEGLNLTKEQRRALRQRIAGAHLINRVTPDSGKLGSKGATIHVHHTTKLDGKVVSRSVTSHQTKANRRKPTQTRGQQTR